MPYGLLSVQLSSNDFNLSEEEIFKLVCNYYPSNEGAQATAEFLLLNGTNVSL